MAMFLSKALVELEYRTNPNPLLTSASEILSSKDPAEDFKALCKGADGGVVFIDEAYAFSPAPKGSRSNDSNKVIDVLISLSSTMKNTTFI